MSLEEAVSLYRGPFLDGLSVSSLPFQEWLLMERERLARQMINALRRLAIKYAGAGQLDKAINYAWQQVELEPWEEEGQRLLIRLLVANGRRGEALAQYGRCCQILRETFDIEPSTDTVSLYNQILAGELLPASTLGDPENHQLI
jgi:DNA-binding SARP family transcriptional activator